MGARALRTPCDDHKAPRGTDVPAEYRARYSKRITPGQVEILVRRCGLTLRVFTTLKATNHLCCHQEKDDGQEMAEYIHSIDTQINQAVQCRRFHDGFKEKKTYSCPLAYHRVSNSTIAKLVAGRRSDEGCSDVSRDV